MFLRTVAAADVKNETGSRKEGISLFTGAGGMDIGFAKAGLHSKVMVEWDKFCCETLRCNWTQTELLERFARGATDFPEWWSGQDPVIMERDITKLPTSEILEAGEFKVGEATFVIGGPPCQGFSMAGKRMIDDPQNALYKEFVRVVREALPKFFLFENVPGLVSMAKGEIIKQICKDFAACGYDVQWDVLDAADYGVPQHRKRVLIIGTRKDVMILKENGRVELHLAGAPGTITHPDKFVKKYCRNECKFPEGHLN